MSNIIPLFLPGSIREVEYHHDDTVTITDKNNKKRRVAMDFIRINLWKLCAKRTRK